MLTVQGLNIGDFSRYCKKPSSGYIQLLALPLLNASVAIFAAISAACLLPIYGSDKDIQLYQPYDIVVRSISQATNCLTDLTEPTTGLVEHQ